LRSNEEIVDLRRQGIEIEVGVDMKLFEIDRAFEEAGDFGVNVVGREIDGGVRDVEPLSHPVVDTAGNGRFVRTRLECQFLHGNLTGVAVDIDLTLRLFERDGGAPRLGQIDLAGSRLQAQPRRFERAIPFDRKLALRKKRRIEDRIVLEGRRDTRERRRHDVGGRNIDAGSIGGGGQETVQFEMRFRLRNGEVGVQHARDAAIAAKDDDTGGRRLEADAVDLIDEVELRLPDAEAGKIAERRGAVVLVEQSFEHGTDKRRIRLRHFAGRRESKRDAGVGPAEHGCADAVEIDRCGREHASKERRHAQLEGNLRHPGNFIAVRSLKLDIGETERQFALFGGPDEDRVANGEIAALERRPRGILDHLVQDGDRDRAGREPPCQHGQKHGRHRDGNTDYFQRDFTGPADQEIRQLLTLAAMENAELRRKRVRDFYPLPASKSAKLGPTRSCRSSILTAAGRLPVVLSRPRNRTGGNP
jgi:hypothetical protein